MRKGSSLKCPRKFNCVPATLPKKVRFADGADSARDELSEPWEPISQPFTPPHLPEDCCYSFDAVRQANNLTLEVFFEETDDKLKALSTTTAKTGVCALLSNLAVLSSPVAWWDFLDLVIAQHNSKLDDLIQLIWNEQLKDFWKDEGISLLATNAAYTRRQAEEATVEEDNEHMPSEPEDDQSADSDNSNGHFQQVALFALGGGQQHARVRWDDHEQMTRGCCRALGWHLSDLAHLFDVNHVPRDLQEPEIVPLIAQHVNDLDVGNTLKYVLVDVEYYQNQPRATPRTWRTLKLLPPRLHRQALLEILRLSPYCDHIVHQEPSRRCLLWHNGALVKTQSKNPMELKHGDYVQIALPPRERSSTPTEYATRCMASSIPEERIDAHFDHRLETDEELRYVPPVATRFEVTEDNELMHLFQKDMEPSLAQVVQPIPNFAQDIGEDAIPQLLEEDIVVEIPLDLLNLWRSEQRIDEDGELYIELETWHLTHPQSTRRSTPRRLFLYADQHNWLTTFAHLWSDQLDPAWPMEIMAVLPQVPMSDGDENLAGHVLVTQRIPVDQRAILHTTMNFLNGPPRLEHEAALVTQSIASIDLTDFVRIGDDCPPAVQTTHCSSWFDGQVITAQTRLNIPHGANIVTIIQPAFLTQAQNEDDDSTSLMQRLQPGEPRPAGFFNELYFLEDLTTRWREHAQEGTYCEPSATVTTYFLHPRIQRHCRHARAVNLFSDPAGWLPAIRRAWHDVLDPAQELFFWVAQPQPPGTSTPNCAHVLIGQGLHESHRIILTSLIDELDPLPSHVASLHERTISTIGLLVNVGCLGTCSVNRLYHGNCVVTHDGTRFQEDELEIQLSNGMAFTVAVSSRHRRSRPTSAPTLLQLRKHLHEQRAPPQHDPPITIDIGPVQEALQKFDTHFILPVFDTYTMLPQANWHPAALDWLTLPWFAFDGDCTEVWIYFDGSTNDEMNLVGFAAAAFVKTVHGWAFAGLTSGSLPQDATGSYKAELWAATCAAKMAYDLLKGLQWCSKYKPTVKFLFDSITVGKQMEGTWAAKVDVTHGHCLRAIVKLIETRFEILCQYEHVPGHKGDPGNEMVDEVAKRAAAGETLHDWTGFAEILKQRTFQQTMGWFWICFDPQWAKQIDSSDLCLPMWPSTQPTVDDMLLPKIVSTPQVQWKVNLVAATGNVLTLKSNTLRGQPAVEVDATWGAAGPSRFESLLRQLDEEGAHIFAFQETRLRRRVGQQDARYILIHALANEQGHYGITVGLHRGKPHGQHGAEQSVFTDTDYAVIVAEHRLLVLRLQSRALKCIVVAAHAPHQGNEEQVIQDFWDHVSSSIPPKYSQWPVLLLTDANCKMGSEPSTLVGSWQAETSSDKAFHFNRFLHQHQIWLPSTFESAQIGMTGTWQHTNGQWSRIDYVGLPVAWEVQCCQAYIADVDLSILREDHQLAVVRCEFTTTASNIYGQWQRKVTVAHLDAELLRAEAQDQWITPSQNVRTHAADIHGFVTRLACHPKAKHSKTPKKTTITEATWELVCHKREHRNHLATLNTQQRNLTLLLVFEAWKGQTDDQFYDDNHAHQRNLDKAIAVELFEFRKLGRQVTAAMRADDNAFYRDLANEAGTLCAPEHAKKFWTVLRRQGFHR